MRLLILQYAGDYREAVQRFAHGGSENYYAQKYTVDGLAELAQQLEELTVLCCTSGEVYDEILENGVRAVGGGFEGRIVDEAKIIELIQRLQPTHIVFYTSLRKVLRWAIKQQIQVLGMLAESIVVKNWRDRWHTFQLTHLLNQPQVEWVGSYGITSSKLLQVLGVKAEKIIPWDFLITTTPGSYSPKTLPNTTTPRQLVYVGSLSESKGVGDVFRAVALLRQQNFPFCLKVVGNDIGGEFANLAASLNIADVVEFLGIIPNSDVVPLMRESDVVLVPSRHEYTEGFPLTIHHALCSRTPLVASDHPMFADHLIHHTNAVVFPAANAPALAASLENLLTTPTLYEKLSQESYNTWYCLRLPVKWGDLLNRWVFPSPANQQWFQSHSLAAIQKAGDRPSLAAIISASTRL